ncbi:unnamed protein product [Acanthosepion pharaonis]|uniref:Uncharacterized protein n=1 Tax=Acanthosepion pharaonis TaxID=158019 RepID=A0A812BYB4_ACAPH|nr:unnamed protein product [Sepia pharaonis]
MGNAGLSGGSSDSGGSRDSGDRRALLVPRGPSLRRRRERKSRIRRASRSSCRQSQQTAFPAGNPRNDVCAGMMGATARAKPGQQPNRAWATFGSTGLSPPAIAVSGPTVYHWVVSRSLELSLSKVLFNFPSPNLSYVTKQPDSRIEGRRSPSAPTESGTRCGRPRSRELRTTRDENERLPSTHAPHVPKPFTCDGIRRWASPGSLAVTKGIHAKRDHAQ